MPLIRYIGTKPTKTDNVCNSGTVWNGHGDDQQVTDAVAAKLLVHDTVWALTEVLRIEASMAQDTEPDEPPPLRFSHVDGGDNLYQLRDAENDEIVDLTLLDTPTLKAFVRTSGLKVDLRKKDDELRSLIVATVIHAADPKE
jgi:hypothetical protein